MIFRDATRDDVAAVVALVESAYRGETSRAGWTTEAHLLDGQRTDAAAVDAIITSPDSRVILGCDDDGAIVVCCQVERYPHATCYFGMFSVTPTAQGGGLGRAMLAEAERFAREEWGATTMRMSVIKQRDDLIAWYVRRGYEATDEMHAFPYGDERYGIPRRDDLEFRVLTKRLVS